MQLHASALQLGAGTGVQLIAAPGAGKSITVLGMAVSTLTATIVSLRRTKRGSRADVVVPGSPGGAMLRSVVLGRAKPTEGKR